MKGIKLEPSAIYNAQFLPLGDSLVAYFQDKRPVGGFLTALLSNDLMEAYAHADDNNRAAMKGYVMWLYNDAPGRGSSAWGSREAVKAWAPGSG